jgi:hypothetical protein
MQTSHFTTRTANISLEKEGYLKIDMLPDVVVDAEDALDNLLVIKNLCAGKKTLKLVDARGKWSMTTEARKVSKKNFSPETTLARAYIVDSFLTKIMFNFLRSFTEKKVPEEFFNHEEEAVTWLLSNKNINQNKP